MKCLNVHTKSYKVIVPDTISGVWMGRIGLGRIRFVSICAKSVVMSGA